MSRAVTRTVFVVQAAVSGSMKRVEEAGVAWARSPCRQPATVTSVRLVVAGAEDGGSTLPSGAPGDTRMRA
jgi:hypothetical protein